MNDTLEITATNSLIVVPSALLPELIGNQVLRLSQEFPEKYSGEILRNFVVKNSKEFLKTVIPRKCLILVTNSGEFLENFEGISYRK